MVLILSTGSDSSTSAVINWLKFYGSKFFRINHPEDELNFIKSDLDNTIISVNGVQLNIKDFSSFWYRKGIIESKAFSTILNSNYNKRVERHLFHENKVLTEFIYTQLERDKKTSTISESVDVNKLIVLNRAKQNNIRVPYAKIVSTKKEVVETLKSFAGLITKPLSSYHLTISVESKRFMTFTTKISQEKIKEIPDEFLPSLIQEYIPKKYEIRAFYWDGKFYSMAIFSQQTEQTALDFRKYSTDYPNRTIPFKLPNQLETKLKKLMDDLKLSTGSIDLIYSTDNEFYFLEVNPVGQFGMVSYPCNYHLEKIIAQFLTNTNHD